LIRSAPKEVDRVFFLAEENSGRGKRTEFAGALKAERTFRGPLSDVVGFGGDSAEQIAVRAERVENGEPSVGEGEQRRDVAFAEREVVGDRGDAHSAGTRIHFSDLKGAEIPRPAGVDFALPVDRLWVGETAPSAFRSEGGVAGGGPRLGVGGRGRGEGEREGRNGQGQEFVGVWAHRGGAI
jgi:hypothetical protein